MDGEGAVDNVKQSIEEQIKQKKKDKKRSAKSVVEAHNVDTTKVDESARTSENECISEAKRNHKGGKKKKKTKKSKGAEDVEADMNNVSRKGKLTVASGENGGVPKMDDAERNGESSSGLAVDDAERKRKQREKKKKNEKFEMHDTEEVKRDESTDWQAGESVSEKQSAKEVMEEKKKQKVKRNDRKEVEKDGEVIRGRSENCIVNATVIMKETKKDKKRRKHDSLVVKGSDDTSPNKSNKKVRFSGQDEVFLLPPKSNTEEGNDKEEDNLVKGKRFTHDEDEIVKDAVMKYIEEHELGDEGVEMVLNSSKHPELKGCWKEIGFSIPYRPYSAVYYRARILLMRSESRKWTQEEYDMILKHQEVHGNKWKPLADELGKHAWHVKDTWRRIKLPNVKKGNWSQEEYQRLFDLVNTDLQLKLCEEKKSKHGMLRDNICWTAISDALSTRAQSNCCLKWYKQLTSPMVAQGIWADSDDYRLLSALYTLDATCLEDVEWDDLIDNRAGDVCRKRWNQMVLHLGHNGNKSFAEQVEVLAQRYCPHLLEARESWDNKPRVP